MERILMKLIFLESLEPGEFLAMNHFNRKSLSGQETSTFTPIHKLDKNKKAGKPAGLNVPGRCDSVYTNYKCKTKGILAIMQTKSRDLLF